MSTGPARPSNPTADADEDGLLELLGDWPGGLVVLRGEAQAARTKQSPAAKARVRIAGPTFPRCGDQMPHHGPAIRVSKGGEVPIGGCATEVNVSMRRKMGVRPVSDPA